MSVLYVHRQKIFLPRHQKMAQYVTYLVVCHPHNYYKTAGGQCIRLISNSVLTPHKTKAYSLFPLSMD